MKKHFSFLHASSQRAFGWVLVAAALVLPARAEWQTQSFNLKEGWNAIYTHVDAGHTTLADLVGAAEHPVEEVWLWQPNDTTLQFIDSPNQAPGIGTQWAVWKKSNDPSANTLATVPGNHAFLVRLADGAGPFVWDVKGRVAPPAPRWSTSGLNFVGFPTSSGAPPNFEDFFAKAPQLQQMAEVFRYQGGELSGTNPARVFALRNTLVNRGEAFWIRSGELFNRYFGPFEVELQQPNGAQFGDRLGQYRIRLRNLVNAPLTVTMNVLDSETPPAGMTAIAGQPPLLLRGELDATTLTYEHTTVNGVQSQWTLNAAGSLGSEVEVVLGLDRSQMSGDPGSLFAAILQFTDSLGYSEINVPVSGSVASTAGLWIGEALVNQVQHQLVSYQRDSDGHPEMDSEGQYIADEVDDSFGTVSQPFPLRIILHQNAGGESKLLQQVYHGLNAAEVPITTTQLANLAPEHLESARRITAVHLPWSEANSGWDIDGELGFDQTLTATIDVSYDDHASNPFLHTYHPDHDNLDPSFSQTLPRGRESYGVSRTITMNVTAPEGDFASRTRGSLTLTGEYEEVITVKSSGSETREYQVQGAFALVRVSDNSALDPLP